MAATVFEINGSVLDLFVVGDQFSQISGALDTL